MNKSNCLKCKDCKYFAREKIRQSRSGNCGHVKWKCSLWETQAHLLGVTLKLANYLKNDNMDSTKSCRIG